MHDSTRLISRQAPKNVQGSALLIAVVMLMLFSILVLAGSQILVGEQRINANQSDKQFAFQLAELALKDAEAKTNALDVSLDMGLMNDAVLYGQLFTMNCVSSVSGAWSKGLCLPATRTTPASEVAWKRVTGSNAVLSPCGNSQEYIYETGAGACSGSTVQAGSKVWANPHYIVELLDINSLNESKTGHLFRITVQAWGRNQNTQVSLQTFFFIPATSQFAES